MIIDPFEQLGMTRVKAEEWRNYYIATFNLYGSPYDAQHVMVYLFWLHAKKDNLL